MDGPWTAVDVWDATIEANSEKYHGACVPKPAGPLRSVPAVPLPCLVVEACNNVQTVT